MVDCRECEHHFKAGYKAVCPWRGVVFSSTDDFPEECIGFTPKPGTVMQAKLCRREVNNVLSLWNKT